MEFLMNQIRPSFTHSTATNDLIINGWTPLKPQKQAFSTSYISFSFYIFCLFFFAERRKPFFFLLGTGFSLLSFITQTIPL
ncbi:hypothetical protein K450DRAFT_232932 [Umbelopsis ramanniana AG]|uniref:Uncharacterized protein n=1 Tax=Umbelopsis ramanniana AG TaxID=1314678 RepID=A0AAD5EDI0_UMBRA|nr:uncharacterized protein K450DRAFT_232932 [Umbelopsis ramanniana AG]KAI8581407.1 hypothetical protein K450DRAFT_232932 [Umbelopsis ramanniana AG]